MRQKRPYSRLAVCILIKLLAVISVLAQDQKVIEWANHASPNTGKVNSYWSKQVDLIELEDILIAGRSIKIGEPFVAGPDWIRDITFRVKNISGEPVTFVQITLTLSEMKFSPQIQYLAMSADRKQKSLLPGEEVELRIPSAKLYDWVKDSVAREMELSKISRAAIYFVLAISQKGGEQPGGCVKVTDLRNACPFASP